MKRPTPVTRLLGVLAGLSLFVAACGDDDDTGVVDETTEEVDPTVEETETEMDTETETEMDTETETDTEMEMGMMEVQLDPLNESGISGTATLEMNDDGTVTVSINTSGYTGGNPHAQHFHIGGENRCPDMSAAGEDGILTSAEGQPAYGPVMVSLTTEGDVGADSALAVERFPVADDNGDVSYERTFELPSGVTGLEDVVIVQHGLASMGGDPSVYDGDMESSLDPSLPLEATIPVACGAVGQQ